MGAVILRIAIAGGTGFIGRNIARFYEYKGHEVLILTRKRLKNQNYKYVTWLNDDYSFIEQLEDLDVLINLAGVSINQGRWTKKHQKKIYESRMFVTEELIKIIQQLEKKPKVFINASAIGIYPTSLTKIYTEQSRDVADDFLAKTVVDWEEKAKQVERIGIRTVFCRFGVVLGKNQGALPLMVLPYKLFVGGTIGSGEQWISWIHIDDVVKAIAFIVDQEHISGPVNITAPTPVTMKEFGQTIGKVLKRPHWFPVPASLLNIALGKKSKLVVEGQYVLPNVLMKEGLQFKYPTLKQALENLLIESY